jgi:hypothetical protein
MKMKRVESGVQASPVNETAIAQQNVPAKIKGVA